MQTNTTRSTPTPNKLDDWLTDLVIIGLLLGGAYLTWGTDGLGKTAFWFAVFLLICTALKLERKP